MTADPGFEVMNRTAGGAAVTRSNCRIHYKINLGGHNDRGRQSVGMDVVTDIHAAGRELGALTGTSWVFDGYTHATWASARGKDWAMRKGVLIELTTRGHWSQPKPNKGPRYTGGIVWFDMDSFRDAGRYGDWTGIKGSIRHELAHQYGLGDLYDSVPFEHSVSIRYGNRMGNSRHPWGPGDRAGLRAMSKAPRATCAG